ncbi:MAG: endonuclease/exonuclease/phosphatase family protein [Kiloniellaceae bacterium]
MSEKAQKTLKLATWNIHSGVGVDKRFDLERMAAAVTAIDADVIGLQEVGWHRQNHQRVDHFAFLRDNTNYRVVEGLVRDPLRTHFGNALLTRLPLGETRWIDLKVRGHVPRAALLVDLQLADTPIRVAVAHFGLAAWEREWQAQRLIDVMTQDKRLPRPTALLGDFNFLRARTRASQILSSQFPTVARLPTFPVRTPRLSLDRIYLSPEWEMTEAQVFREGGALQASDHLPLVAQAHLTG